ncbi:hypothetical protein ACP275_13G063600 [Erythranthe tilingii]
MKIYAVVLIGCGCVAALLLHLCYLICKINARKKKTPTAALAPPPPPPTALPPPPPPPRQQPVIDNRDVERGEKPKSSGLKDGGMVVLGAGAVVAATAAVISSGVGGDY